MAGSAAALASTAREIAEVAMTPPTAAEVEWRRKWRRVSMGAERD
jgi:hypothetical protein